MLEMLMSNPGRLISTEQFMERIWGYDTEAEVSVVWVYIDVYKRQTQHSCLNLWGKKERCYG